MILGSLPFRYSLAYRGLTSVLILLFFASAFWAGADTRALPFLRAGALLAIVPWCLVNGHQRVEIRVYLKRMLRDPLLLPVVLAAVVLTIRWVNAWFARPVELGHGQFWFDGQAAIEGLPSAIFGDYVERSLWALLYVAIVALLIRHVVEGRRPLNGLLWGMVTMGCVYAIWGIMESLLQVGHYYGRYEVERPFFGPFFYNNHAAQFCYLSLAALGALWLQGGPSKTTGSDRLPRILMLIALPCLLLALFVIVSRAGLVIGLALVVLIIGVMWRRNQQTALSAQSPTTWLALGAVLVLIGVVVMARFGENLEYKLAGAKKRGFTPTSEVLSTRAWQWDAAVKMWRQYPLWGVGPDGFKHFVVFYAPPDRQAGLTGQHAGQVHNDFLQFLCQQGLVGMALLLWGGVCWLRPLLQRPMISPPQRLILCMGGAALVVHSLLDLPFASIGVCTILVAVLTVAGKAVQVDPHTPEARLS